ESGRNGGPQPGEDLVANPVLTHPHSRDQMPQFRVACRQLDVGNDLDIGNGGAAASEPALSRKPGGQHPLKPAVAHSSSQTATGDAGATGVRANGERDRG